MRWEGKYYNVDGTGNVKDPLLFFIVNRPINTASARGSHDRLFSIPITWMNDDMSTFLHPPMDLKVGGIHFWDWSFISLNLIEFESLLEFNIIEKNKVSGIQLERASNFRLFNRS